MLGGRGKEAAAADGTVGPTPTRNETQLLRWEVARLETTLNNMRKLIPGLGDIPALADEDAAVVAESAPEASPSVSSIHEGAAHAAANRASRSAPSTCHPAFPYPEGETMRATRGEPPGRRRAPCNQPIRVECAPRR